MVQGYPHPAARQLEVVAVPPTQNKAASRALASASSPSLQRGSRNLGSHAAALDMSHGPSQEAANTTQTLFDCRGLTGPAAGKEALVAESRAKQGGARRCWASTRPPGLRLRTEARGSGLSQLGTAQALALAASAWSFESPFRCSKRKQCGSVTMPKLLSWLQDLRHSQHRALIGQGSCCTPRFKKSNTQVALALKVLRQLRTRKMRTGAIPRFFTGGEF